MSNDDLSVKLSAQQIAQSLSHRVLIEGIYRVLLPNVPAKDWESIPEALKVNIDLLTINGIEEKKTVEVKGLMKDLIDEFFQYIFEDLKKPRV